MNVTAIEKITLEEIIRRKQTVLQEIRQEQKRMRTHIMHLITPPRQASNHQEGFAGYIHWGIGIFNKVLIGFKVAQRLWKLFRRH